ncbi:MAG: lipopolysaccharide biosynthesis protein [Armatimonadota bacterium]
MAEDSDRDRQEYDRRVRRVAKGGGLDVLGRFASRGIGVISAPVTSRLLGGGGYGLYFVATQLIVLLSLLVLGGYPRAVLRYVGIYDGEGRPRCARAVVVGTLFTAMGIAAVFAALLVLFPDLVTVDIYGKPSMTPVLQILAVCLPARVAFLLLSQATVARGTALYRVLSDLANRVVILAGVLLLCGALDLGPDGAAYAYVLGAAGAGAVALAGVMRLYGRVQFRDLRHFDLYAVTVFAFPLLLEQLSQYGLYRANAVIGGRWLSDADLGQYGAASQAAIVGVFGLSALGLMFSPIMADLHNRDKMDDLREMFATTTRWGYYFAVPVLTVAFLKPESVMAVFGPEFADAGPVLQLLSVGQLLSVSAGAAGYVLIMSGYQWLSAFDSFLMAAVNIVLCIVLTRWMGIVGLAIAGMVATGGVNLLRAAQVWWIHRISGYTLPAVRPLLIGVALLPIMLISLEPWWLDLLVPLGLYTTAFVLAVRRVGLDRDDRQVLNAIRRRLRSVFRPSPPTDSGG